ncbi:porin [Shewanella sp. GXUN23E]|uniref:porin n=1 Tax=Shewanella sp. GXUN23E TaxID=3422498 RepID=UPI003D7C578B
MMNKLLCTVLMTSCVSAVADESVMDKLTISGYLDASATQVKETDQKADDKLQLDTLELRFDYQVTDRLTVNTHIRGSGVDENVILEQAHLNYLVAEGVTLTAGKFLSVQGFEAYHSPDLYQYSTSATLVYPGMMNGVSMRYDNDLVSVYGAIVSSAWDSEDGDVGDNGYEAAIKLRPISGLSVHLGYTSEDRGNDTTRALFNGWASYQVGQLLMAAEYNHIEDWIQPNDKGDGWLVMGNYHFNDSWGLTLRTSALKVKSAGGDDLEDISKWTVAPLYSVNENWEMIFEYNRLKNHLTGTDTDTFAIEAIVVF